MYSAIPHWLQQHLVAGCDAGSFCTTRIHEVNHCSLLRMAGPSWVTNINWLRWLIQLWGMSSAVSCYSKQGLERSPSSMSSFGYSGAQEPHLVRRVSSYILTAKYGFSRNCGLQQISRGELVFSGGIPSETCLAETLPCDLTHRLPVVLASGDRPKTVRAAGQSKDDK